MAMMFYLFVSLLVLLRLLWLATGKPGTWGASAIIMCSIFRPIFLVAVFRAKADNALLYYNKDDL